jgi:outer membrane protein assembly factor BamB
MASRKAGGHAPLYVGAYRFVAALDSQTGEEQWRTKLPKCSMGSLVTLVVKGDRIYAGCGGQAYCLNKQTGELIWHNKLPKMSYFPVMLAMEGAAATSGADALAAAHAAMQAAAT